MDPTHDPSMLHTLTILFKTLVVLMTQLAAFGFHWAVWIVWGAWCLWGINWKKTRHFLAVGGWAPTILLMLLVALVWSRLDPFTCNCMGGIIVPNFWCQLGYVTILALIAMFGGWLQSVFHWTPHEISLDPPAHGHDHGHDHGHH